MNAVTQALWDYASHHEPAYDQVTALAHVAREGDQPAALLAVMFSLLVRNEWLPEVAHPGSCTGFVRCAVLREIDYQQLAADWLEATA